MTNGLYIAVINGRLLVTVIPPVKPISFITGTSIGVIQPPLTAIVPSPVSVVHPGVIHTLSIGLSRV